MDPKLIAQATKLFKDTYGVDPDVLTTAPGRVNLIGEHTDYNDGFVCPLGINKYTVVAGKKIPGEISKVVSVNEEGDPINFKINDEMKPLENSWANYVLGVIDVYKEKFHLAPFAIEMAIASDVPLGGGLSSSASLEVATGLLLEQLLDLDGDDVERAKMCQEAEHRYPKCMCGIMDQYISSCADEGYALLIDCRSFKAEKVPLNDPNVALIVCNSNKKHQLNGGEYNERVACCNKAVEVLKTVNSDIRKLRDATLEDLEKVKDQLSDTEYKRARHGISEDDRAIACVNALKDGNLKEAGKYLYESHESLKNDYEVSTEELDTLVEIAKSLDGVYGSRMTGGGFGGCTITMVEASKKEKIMEEMRKQYKEKTGIDCDIFATTPCEGAHLVSTKKGQCECCKNNKGNQTCSCNNRGGKSENCCCMCKSLKTSVNKHPYLWGLGILAAVGGVAYAVAKRKH